MPKPCIFCNHSDRQSLEEALLKHGITQQKVASILGVNRSSVSRHMQEHISQEPDSQRIDELEKQLSALQDRVAMLEKELRDHKSWGGHRRF